jgi:RNA polymerase sigma factor (TIGR02999 family)
MRRKTAEPDIRPAADPIFAKIATNRLSGPAQTPVLSGRRPSFSMRVSPQRSSGAGGVAFRGRAGMDEIIEPGLNLGVVTQQLRRAQDGDAEALGAAYSTVYDDLRRCARRYLRNDRVAMSTISLINETFLRVATDAGFRPKDRPHLIGLTSRAMRQVLVEKYRSMVAIKRGGGEAAVTLSEDLVGFGENAMDAIELDRVLAELEAVDQRMARIVEWRYFGGYSEMEIAEALGVTDRTVQREWRKARAFLLVALSGADASGADADGAEHGNG